MAAGALAGRRCHATEDPDEVVGTRVWQGIAAGLVSTGVGALFVTVFGSATVTLLIRSASVRDWLYHGQHLTASAVYGRELYASQDTTNYFFPLVAFPIIGLILSMIAAAIANPVPRLPDGSDPPRPPGSGGPEPRPDPPDGGRRADVTEPAAIGSG